MTSIILIYKVRVLDQTNTSLQMLERSIPIFRDGIGYIRIFIRIFVV